MKLFNYYKVLELDNYSSIRTIKKQFRVKAKAIHPDVRKPSSRRATEEMRLLLKAYKILSNPERKQEYDNLLRKYEAKQKVIFNYRFFLKQRKDDLYAQSKLVFYDLLHSREKDALSLYRRLMAKPSFNLKKYMAWDDFMDCSFLLAEQFDLIGEYEKAYALFKEIYLNELKRPYFKHYIDEVIERLKILSCFKMQGVLPSEQIMKYLKELISFNFSSKSNAYFYKKMAEIYLNEGNEDLAVKFLQRAINLDKRIEGIKYIKKKLKSNEIKIFI